MGESGINVETGGLTEFAKEVHADTDVFLGPARDRAAVQFSSGIRFGVNNPSDAVLAAKDRYRQSLTASTANLDAYVAAARLLANAADRVATMLKETDADAARTTAAAEQALWAAAEEARLLMLAASRPTGSRVMPI